MCCGKEEEAQALAAGECDQVAGFCFLGVGKEARHFNSDKEGGRTSNSNSLDQTELAILPRAMAATFCLNALTAHPDYSSFRGGLCSIGRVAHFNGRSICFSTSLQIFVGKIAGPLLEPFRDPKSGPARNHKQKLYIYFCGVISGAVKRTHFWAHLLARLLL